jgi:anti-sigma regulatory factor (Ser/Thr protein kinase)
MAAPAHELTSEPRPGFSHRALLYTGEEGFVDGTLPFIHAGLDSGEPTLVVVGPRKIEILSEALNGDGDLVHFADMVEIGTNPARIIPVWHEFVDRHAAAGSGLRGIGEPVWPKRSAAELSECRRHEELLNVAFAHAAGFDLLCPYDTSALDAAVIDAISRSHPRVIDGDGERASDTYPGVRALAAPFAEPLADPPDRTDWLPVDATTLAELRAHVRSHAVAAALDERLVDDLVIGVHELACNSIKHGGGHGIVGVWRSPDAVVCEVRDSGEFDAPLAGRRAPDPLLPHGRGLWLANQLCDLVQLRTGADGTVARVYMSLG